MNNFGVLLKYSLKPKMLSKKSLLTSLAMFITILVVIVGGAFIVVKPLMNKESQVAFYPNTELSQSLAASYPGALVINRLPEEKVDDAYIIDTDTNRVYSYGSVSVIETQLINSQLSSIKVANVLGTQNEQLQNDIAEANVAPSYINLSKLTDITDPDSPEKSSTGNLETINIIFIFIIYMIIIFGVQWIGNEIFEEKSARAMEIIMTSTSPKTHMLVKIVSNTIYIIYLGIVCLLAIIAGVFALKILMPDTLGVAIEFIANSLTTANIDINGTAIAFIVLTLLSGLLTVIIFQALAAVLAASTTTMDDFQKAFVPIVFIAIVPYFVAMMPIPDTIKIGLSFVPLFTPFFAPTLFISGAMSLYVLIACTILQFLTVIIIFIVLSPIYKEGVLNYSSSPFIEIVKRAYSKK